MGDVDEIKRLLGEEDRPSRPSLSPPRPPPYVWVCDAIAYIEHLEEAQTDALAKLDNMEDGLQCISSDPRRHECAGFKSYTCIMPDRRNEVCRERHDAAYWARMYRPSDPPTEEPEQKWEEPHGTEEGEIPTKEPAFGELSLCRIQERLAEEKEQDEPTKCCKCSRVMDDPEGWVEGLNNHMWCPDCLPQSLPCPDCGEPSNWYKGMPLDERLCKNPDCDVHGWTRPPTEEPLPTELSYLKDAHPRVKEYANRTLKEQAKEPVETRVLKPISTREPHTREQQLSQDLEPENEGKWTCDNCGATRIDEEETCRLCGDMVWVRHLIEEPEKEEPDFECDVECSMEATSDDCYKCQKEQGASKEIPTEKEVE